MYDDSFHCCFSTGTPPFFFFSRQSQFDFRPCGKCDEKTEELRGQESKKTGKKCLVLTHSVSQIPCVATNTRKGNGI